jgi:hypothetical protein
VIMPLGIYGENSRDTVMGKAWVGYVNVMPLYIVLELTNVCVSAYASRAWTANTSFGTPLQKAEPMIVDLGSVTILVPNRIIETSAECPEVSSTSLGASNYSLTGSSSAGTFWYRGLF